MFFHVINVFSSEMFYTKNRKLLIFSYLRILKAEREGFEPPVPLSTPVFKTGAFDHSAISPLLEELGLCLKASAKVWVLCETCKFLPDFFQKKMFFANFAP